MKFIIVLILLACECPTLVHSTNMNHHHTQLTTKDPFNPSQRTHLKFPQSMLRRTLSIRGGGKEMEKKHKSSKTKQQDALTINTRSIQSNSNGGDLPSIKAVLLPRQLSIPRIIRLLSAFLFSSSLVESLRTSGMPYTNAVKSTLQAHGMNTLLGMSSEKITALDKYFAEKISQSENNLLPPRHFPSSLPLLGLVLSMVLHVGLTMLFPKWFIELSVWMNYQRVDVHVENNDGGLLEPLSRNNNPQHLQMIESCLEEKGADVYDDDAMDEYYQSQFINRIHAPIGKSVNSKPTGLAVLVQLSKQEREMASDGRSEDIQWLYKSETEEHPGPYFIEVGQRRVYVSLNAEGGKLSAKCLDGGPSFYREEQITKLLSRGSTGLSTREDLEYAISRYGSYNDMSLPIPTVNDAFFTRMSSPLAVLQLVGRVLTALEESFVPAFMNILMTLGQHYMNAKKSIISAKELSSEIRGNVEDASEQMFFTLRPKSDERRKSRKKSNKEWMQIPASQLLPGDVFYLPSRDVMMPVDAILLEGNCIAQEAVITGESVPQAKVPIEPDSSEEDSSEVLSMDSKHRNSVLFAGTTVMNCANEGGFSNHDNLPKALADSSSPVKCLALKTGSYSSKGEIIRALSKSSSHAGSISTLQSERDSLRLISVLSSFAVLACVSLFIPSSDRVSIKTSGFRRVIQCTRIAVASIPSDLPLALSCIVNTCATMLRKEADVVCSEPGSLLTASQIDMVVFDKTGTLTSDTQAMTDIVNLPRSLHHPMSEVVLAGCHSLSSIIGSTSKPIGDPLDVASLEYSCWAFNSTDKTACARDPLNRVTDDIVDGTRVPNGTKLWQIKSFPFDPSRRRSSALVLVQHEDNKFRLWKVVKGSPDGMRSLLLPGDGGQNMKEGFLTIYDNAAEVLGSKGTRIVALAVQDVTKSSLTKTLFPRGLPRVKDLSPKSVSKKVSKHVAIARNAAKHELHIGDFERSVNGSMNFAGFACFDASIRPSTPRIVEAIRGSGTTVCMLTGDGSAAALSVARQARFFDREKCKKVAVLDVKDNSQLVWTLMKLKNGVICNDREFNLQRTVEMIANQQKGKYAIMITGNAIESILEPAKEDRLASKHLLYNLDKVAVISRSSPQTKQQVLSVLKSHCGRTVMMCGDGVNDISAMKTADISCALLNGYGREKNDAENNVDTENERRKARLKYRKIGRDKNVADFGTEGHNRIKQKLDEVLRLEDGSPKGGFAPIMEVMKEEYRRAKKLQKGGAAAARILQEEESLRKSMLAKTNGIPTETAVEKNDEQDDIGSIKPGEASLAAAFTFLRPCIDGAEATLRTGVAAAAFSLSSHRSIALNSLMACYNLASLYRDGFRYGKYMWNVELAFIIAMDKGQSDVSCMPRPRIPRIRPHESIFEPAVALSVLLQSIIHLFVLTKGVSGASLIQSQCNDQSAGLRIRLAQSNLPGLNMPISSDGGGGGNLLGRVPFQPNLVTNVVFLLSIFQNVIISSVNHSGLPFHGSLLESRSFCIWAAMSILFCIVMALEVQPSLNVFLQLAPMTSRAFQIFIISLFLFDGIASFLADRLCVYFLDRELWKELGRRDYDPSEDTEYAADIEENLLRTERGKNMRLVRGIAMVSIVFVAKALKL